MNVNYRRPAGISVTELLVAIAIISTMMALLIPAVQWSRERARATTCSVHLKQIGYAFTQHDTAHRGYPTAGLSDVNDPLPPWRFAPTELLHVGGGRTQPVGTWGWAYQILPYLDQNVLAQQHVLVKPDGFPNIPIRLEAAATPIIDYFCPSRRAPVALDGVGCDREPGLRGALDYAGNAGFRNRLVGSRYAATLYRYPVAESAIHPDGAVIPAGFVDGTGIFRPERDRVGLGSIADGAASTLLVGERNFNLGRKTDSLNQVTEDNGYMAGYTWDTVRWAYDPPRPDRNDLTSDRETGFGSAHTAGCYFVFCDGAVKMLDYEIDPVVFQQLSSRDDGQSPVVD
jgi:type II secretory pathway pseudopilin PulG